MPRHTNILIDTSSNIQIFLSHKNMYYMAYAILSINKKNMNSLSLNEYDLKNMMTNWASENDIEHVDLAFNDIIENLKYINTRFLEYYKKNYIKDNRLNVYRLTDIVTGKDGIQSVKKYDEMLASDYHTLNLWNNVDIYVSNANSRYNNKIPTWQKSMNTRHYDISNDGLRHAIPERASLNNQTHGYDMSNIIKGAEANYAYQTCQ